MEDPWTEYENWEAVMGLLDIIKDRVALEIKYNPAYDFTRVGLGFRGHQELDLLILPPKKGKFHHKPFSPADIEGMVKEHKNRIDYLKRKYEKED